MTVQTNTNVASFNGNGVTQIFPIAFKFNNDTDLVALLVDDSTGAAIRLTLNSDYTVSGEGDEDGGLINVVVAPATGQRLFVSRVVDILQMTDLRNQGKFFAEVHEDALDLLTMIAQQHQSDIARTLRVAETDPEPERIPSVAQRAGKLLAFDLQGNPTTALPIADSSTELRQELNGGIRRASRVTDLAGLLGRFDGDALHLSSYYGDLAVYDTVNAAGPIAAPMAGAPVGGSMLVWDATLPRSEHDGGMVISPTVPFDGDPANLTDFLDGVGETDPAALGCWVRVLADGIVYVTYYGARPVIGFDSTRAFNGATEAFKAYGISATDGNENESLRKRVIGVPASADPFEIHGTVYVRKGQHLRGLGDGPCRIVIPIVTSSAPTFKLAYGFVGGVEVVDDGGLPPSISNLCTEGGHTTGAVVEATGVAGVGLHKMFITSAPVGFKGAGGDLVLNGCTFDACASSVEITGSRNILADCHFFNPTSRGILVGTGSYDWLIRDCTFAFGQALDIVIQGTENTVRGLSIVDCNFIENGQYATKQAHIAVNMSGAEVMISDCNFSNSKSWAIASLGVNANEVHIRDCHFTGLKSNAAYTQSSTARGIRTGGGKWAIEGCDFGYMFGTPISVNGTAATDLIVIKGNTWGNNTFSGPLVTVGALVAGSRLQLDGNTGDNAMPLISSGNFNGVRVGVNHRWLGAPVTSGGRIAYRIPTFAAFEGLIKIIANPLPGGSALYRKTATFAVGRGTDNISAAIRDYVDAVSLHNPAIGTAGALSVQFDIDALGTGANITPTQVGRNVVVSVPDTYANFEVEIA